MPKTKRILTWLKPTGAQLHIGNYFGAIKPMIDLADQNPDAEIFLFLAIMHSLTTMHDSQELKQNSISALKLYMACGVDPKRFLIYNPALVSGHAELNWVLTCITHMWFMERMHAYKDALNKWNAKKISVGTFCYPILMAADIILYDADIVPVGKDQKQHVEFARDIAQRFNNQFWETFNLPEPYLREEVAVVPGIDGQKMSKSYNNYIGLLDDEKTVLKKVKQVPTSTQTIEEPKNPDECNVYKLTKLFLTPDEDQELRNKYEAWGLSFKYAKDYLYEKLMEFLKPIQERYAEISDQEIMDLVKEHSAKANKIAQEKIQDVYNKVWFNLG